MSRRDRRKAAILVPVASMGDIAFLLIIFFMVCSNFVKEKPITLPKSQAVEGVENSPVSVTIDADGVLYVQGVSYADAASVGHRVGELLVDREGDKAKTVLFKCDHEIDKEVFEPVLDAIAEAGGLIAALGTKTAAP